MPAGLETVVRPVIFPNIRPTPRQSLPPQDDPSKGFAVIRGNPASSVGASFSWTLTINQSFPTEESRTVDDVRVYQKDDNGQVNRDNFVDLQIPTKIQMDAGPSRGRENWNFKPIEESDNVEIKNVGTVI